MANGLLREGRKLCPLDGYGNTPPIERVCAACKLSGRRSRLHACAEHIGLKYLVKFNRMRRVECAPPETLDEDGNRSPCDFPDPSLSPENRVFLKAFHSKIESAMKELTPSQQEVFRQRFIEDIPEAEIARMTGRTLHAIQMAVERVRNQMRRILERRGDDYSSLRGLLPRDAEPEFFLPNDDED